MYNEGDLSFLANVGQLVEPVTLDDWLNKRKQLPLSLGDHRCGQNGDHRGGQNDAQRVYPQNSAAEGVLGRIMNVLVTIGRAFRGDLYSVCCNVKAVEGGKDALTAPSSTRRATRDSTTHWRHFGPSCKRRAPGRRLPSSPSVTAAPSPPTGGELTTDGAAITSSLADLSKGARF